MATKTSQKKGKKRKLKRSARILIVINVLLVICLCISLGAWGIFSYMDKKEQESRFAKLESLLQVEQSKADLIENLQAEGRDEELLETLKNAAMENSPLEYYTSVSQQERIEDEDEAKISAYELTTEALQARFLLEHYDQIDDALLEFYVKDHDRYNFVQYSITNTDLEYPEGKDSATLTENLDSVPLLLQWDTRWGYDAYGDSTIWQAACAPTSLAMVFSYLLQDPTITPETMVRYSEEAGCWVSGVGTSHALMSLAAENYGVDVYQTYVDADSVKAELEEGRILVLNMAPGTFTSIGHFIVATGLQDGKLVINDPNSIERSSKLWDIDEVLSQTNAIWSYGLE
jgi:hypothetical protein